MTKLEALVKLACAPKSEKPSAINGIMTKRQVVDIIWKAVELKKNNNDKLPDWLIHRVNQVANDNK